MNVHVKGSGSAKQGQSARPPKVNLKAPRVAWWTLGLGFIGEILLLFTEVMLQGFENFSGCTFIYCLYQHRKK